MSAGEISFQIEDGNDSVLYKAKENITIPLVKASQQLQSDQFSMWVVLVCFLIGAVIIIMWLFPDGMVASAVKKVGSAIGVSK